LESIGEMRERDENVVLNEIAFTVRIIRSELFDFLFFTCGPFAKWVSSFEWLHRLMTVILL